MKRLILTLFLFIACIGIYAQNNVSAPIRVNIVKEVVPPILNYVPNSLEFIDPNGNNVINANETCKIRFKVVNNGKGEGYGCTAKIKAEGNTQGISVSEQKISLIKVGETKQIEMPVQSGMSTVDGRVTFTVQLDEPMGFGTDPQQISIATKAFVEPLVKITDYSVTAAGGGSLQKKVPFDLQLLLQNTQYGLAENVQVEVSVPDGVFMMDGEALSKFGTLNAGEAKSLVYSLIVNNSYSATTIPIKVKLTEKYGKYAESKTVNLTLNQTLATTKIDVKAAEEKERSQIAIASLTSDVDKNIPVAKGENNNTFAVIIANENYKRASSVPYALNDGEVFSKYCVQTLGIPQSNVHFVRNATLGDMRGEIGWLRGIMRAYKGEANVVFYYAGHGIPDDATKSAYLLPVDGYGSDVRSGYKLDDFYLALGDIPTKSVVVLLDACFSGASRDGNMVNSERGVALKVKSGEPKGNMVVMSAAQGDQTASQIESERHGMFTYYLLKKLQATGGDVTLKDLGDYVTTNVSRQSIVQNSKSQTPCVTPSATVADEWQNWKLK